MLARPTVSSSRPSPSSLVVVLRTLLAAVSATLLPVGLLTLAASSADAHAELIKSSPKDGASLAARPDVVVLTFGEAIDPANARSRVDVAADDDADYTYEPVPKVDGEQVSIPLEDVSSGGDYTVTYRVVSEDGHPVEGRVRFAVASEPAATASVAVTEVTTEPATTEPTALATTRPTTTSSSGDPDDEDGADPVFWLVGGLAVLGAAGTGIALATRRRTP